MERNKTKGNKDRDKHRYDDIIHLPHHISAKHPQMAISDRAAQFSPFAALTGYEAAIAETARLTTGKIELDEDGKAALDFKLKRLREKLSEQPKVTVTYFLSDERKDGGAYVTVTGSIKKIDDCGRALVLGGKHIPMDDILEIKMVDISTE